MNCGVAQTNKTPNCWLLPSCLPLFPFTLNGDLTHVTAAVRREENRRFQGSADCKERRYPEALQHDIRLVN